MLVYVNGRFVPRDEARVSVFDHGYLYGDGVYETMRAYRGKIFLLDRHLSRLKLSADAIGLTLPLQLPQIGGALNEALALNRLREAYLRIQISRGPGEVGLDPALCAAPTMVILAKPFKDYPPELYEKGVGVAITATRRNHPLAQDPAIKSTNFLNNILAKIESLRVGAYEGIMLNWKGFLAEGTISNLFLVKKGILLTPSLDTGILEGITRGFVLSLAKRLRIRTDEALLRPRDLMRADECFITNTTLEVMPVTTVDRKLIGSGAPGPVTRRLRSAYRSEVVRHV